MRSVNGKRISLISLALLLALLLALPLAGCGKSSPAAAAPEESAAPEPREESGPKELRFGSLTVSSDVESLDLAGSGAALEELMRASNELENVKEISLGVTGATLEQLRAVEAAFPQAELNWKAEILGEEIDCRAESLDLGAAADGDLDRILAALAVLPDVKSISLAPQDGVTGLSFESLAALAEAVPEAELNCRFELFGQTADWTSEKLKYYKTDIGNEGIETFRSALPYLRSLELLRLEECGITDNDAMAALRADFPDKRVVWSIPVRGYTFMTDTTLINDGGSLQLSDSDVGVFRYMPDVLYLDIGHNHYLTNIEFVRNWPRLQVVILTLSNIKDITPLEDCPDIEFLEMVSTGIGSIDVVAGMDKLEYLNLGCMWSLRDVSPVAGLKNLKLVRICGSTFTFVPHAQVDELKEALPGIVNDYGGDPTKSGGWRYNNDGSLTERYALLREQMLYDEGIWWKRLSNSPSGEEN